MCEFLSGGWERTFVDSLPKTNATQGYFHVVKRSSKTSELSYFTILPTLTVTYLTFVLG